MIKRDIDIAHFIKDIPEVIYIFARFEVNEELETSEEIADFYDKTKDFSLYLTDKLGFKVFPSVILDKVIEPPFLNDYGIQLLIITPKSENYQEEINKIEGSLKESILKGLPKFY